MRNRDVPRGAEARPNEIIISASRLDRSALGFSAMRDLTAELTDLFLLGAAEEFGNVTATAHLGQALLVDGRVSSLLYDRTSGHVRRGSADHYQLQFHLQGQTHAETERRVFTVRPGDVGLIDMTHVGRYWTTAPVNGGFAHSLVLIVPRRLLAPMLSEPDAAGGTILRAGSPQARLVGGLLLSLWRRARFMTLEEGAAEVRAAMPLIAQAFGARAQVADEARHPRNAKILQQVLSHVEHHIHDGALDVAAICARFNVSRSALYRALEAEGGLVRLIQRRRLLHAFSLLSSPGLRQRRIIDVAVECGFSSDAAFVRAFQRSFGLTPGDVRDAADPGRRHFASLDLSWAGMRRTELLGWISQLGRSE
ncbi:helix-turn-helix domain-containing protein [Bradyrhizobium elkanii]|uniref:helix-turn-helix domain-containing protein n=1 Tax=Bradyrhizobium elkanii TaxID=29448 RepID=UPI0009B7D135|nr:helix-turn-helix domain-containing protein [Bradyrhizobium elkanii]